jgi:hypothetical protein
MHKSSLQKYFDYKRGDKTAKCRICNKKVEKTHGKFDSLTDHLKGHEEFYKMYDSAKRENELKQQQGKRPHGDDDENEVNGGEAEPSVSQSQKVQ